MPKRILQGTVVSDKTDKTIVVEVQQHLSRTRVRGIAMSFTAGLARGVEARATGSPVTVPVIFAVFAIST